MEDYPNRLFRDLVIVLVMLHTFDSFATQYLLSTGLFYECVWWWAKLIDKTGSFIGVVYIKSLLAFFLALLYNACEYPGKIVIFLLTFTVSIYTSLMLWHIYLFSFTTRVL